MSKNRFRQIDTWIMLSGILYVVLPVTVFLAKFTRPYFCITGTLLFAYLIFRIFKESSCIPGFANEDILNRKTGIFLLSSTLVFCVWLYFSGIGSFSFQNWDFWVRNPIYNDLISKSWPMYYNLGTQPENVTNLIGGEWVAFAYYFTYWLLPAGLCKIFHISGLGAQIVLYVYSLLGLIIILLLLCRLFKRFSWKITAIFMTFSGLDVIAYIYKNLKPPSLTTELEWSLIYYQLSGNTTQLYYVFNQSIPVWIIMLLILNTECPKTIAGIAALCFAYSPWATLGLIPIVIVGMFSDYSPDFSVCGKTGLSGGKKFIRKLKNCISICNIFIPVFLLVVFGLYYTASGQAGSGKGLYYFTTGASLAEYITGFIVFILTEFGLYYIALGKQAFKNRYSVVVFIELLLFPLFYVVDFNFFIRGTIPALFILMTILITHVIDGAAARKKLLIIFLVIGAITSVITFTRSVIYTAEGGDILQDDIVTFDDMSNAEDYQILTANSQFFVHGFAAKPFYLYISKLGL